MNIAYQIQVQIAALQLLDNSYRSKLARVEIMNYLEDLRELAKGKWV